MISYPEKVAGICADVWNVDPDDVTGPAKDRAAFEPRAAAMVILRESTNLSLPQIGAMFGGRDHSTVKAALVRTHYLMVWNKAFRAKLAAAYQRVHVECAETPATFHRHGSLAP